MTKSRLTIEFKPVERPAVEIAEELELLKDVTRHAVKSYHRTMIFGLWSDFLPARLSLKLDEMADELMIQLRPLKMLPEPRNPRMDKQFIRGLLLMLVIELGPVAVRRHVQEGSWS